jgi:hypothetical protein
MEVLGDVTGCSTLEVTYSFQEFFDGHSILVNP